MTFPLPSPLHTLNKILHQLSTLPANPDPTTDTLPPTARPPLLTLHVLFPHLLLPALDLLDRRLITRIVLALPGPPDQSHHGPTTTHIIGYSVTSISAALPREYTTRFEGAGRYSNSNSNAASHEDDTATARSLSMARVNRVSLEGWHCTCPAFAFALAGVGATCGDTSSGGDAEMRMEMGMGDEDAVEDGMMSYEQVRAGYKSIGLGFGGLARDGGNKGRVVGESREEQLPPVCKHLLAVALGQWCEGLFGGGTRGMRERVVTGLEEVAGWAAGGDV